MLICEFGLHQFWTRIDATAQALGVKEDLCVREVCALRDNSISISNRDIYGKQ
jgi:hypothetical protein